MSKTNTGLAAHCEKALTEKWYYLWGAYGQLATRDYLDRNIRQYPENEQWRGYASGAFGRPAARFSDCYGLVKSYLWWTDEAANPAYSAAQDVNTSMAYSRAAEKGSLATLPDTPGVLLWMQGHVGVYMGGGRFIECAGGAGALEGRLADGKVIKGSKFVAWFKDVNIQYAAAPQERLADALQTLAAAGVVSSPDYWLQNHSKLQYVDQLIHNMADHVKEKPPGNR